jgi:hypothetical protein
MKIHAIVKTNKTDSYIPVIGNGEESVFLESIFSDIKCKHCTHNIKNVIDNLERFPDGAVVDFANLSLAVYTMDQLISRIGNGYQDWSRYIKVHLPVEAIGNWKNALPKIEAMLSFLTGDKWELEVRIRQPLTNQKQTALYNSNISKVSLFSGGLDSLIGAIDLAATNDEIALISHHKGGGGGEKTAQESLVKALQNEFPKKIIKPNYFYVQPIQEGNKFSGENTQRARSIMFIALGLLVANSYGQNTALEIPENALISLNIPLTMTRYGSYSTKTTHPKFLGMLGDVIQAISITNTLNNPYKFKTKGEMLAGCTNLPFLKQVGDWSISCSKPNYYRRWTKKTRGQRKIETHCGHCVPCIIRRASFHKAGIDKVKGNYVVDILKKSNRGYPDIRAFKIGLARFKRKVKINIFDLFKGGIFPVADANEIANYISVYKRGMKEVDRFLSQ